MSLVQPTEEVMTAAAAELVAAAAVLVVAAARHRPCRRFYPMTSEQASVQRTYCPDVRWELASEAAGEGAAGFVVRSPSAPSHTLSLSENHTARELYQKTSKSSCSGVSPFGTGRV